MIENSEKDRNNQDPTRPHPTSISEVIEEMVMGWFMRRGGQNATMLDLTVYFGTKRRQLAGCRVCTHKQLERAIDSLVKKGRLQLGAGSGDILIRPVRTGKGGGK